MTMFLNFIYKLRKKFGYVNTNGRRYSTTRFVMYNSIEKWIKKYCPAGEVLLVSERNEHSIRKMLGNKCHFTATNFPETDIMNLSKFGKNKFDIVVTDQVLEHVPNPFDAIKQISSVLKIGGIAINTSCSFNPIHDSVDYFRFTPLGFNEIHKNFSEILLLDSWGNKKTIGRFVFTDYISFNVKKYPWEKYLATNNNPMWPWSVWCIARK